MNKFIVNVALVTALLATSFTVTTKDEFPGRALYPDVLVLDVRSRVPVPGCSV